MAIPLSVLDLAHVWQGASSADALRRTVDLARRADAAGYRRFWVAEHHNMASVASTSPPVLIGAIADATERIRVGSGGVMLPNHAPYVVAEQFAMLEALHPERIDVGIGRAPGTDQVTARALRRDAEGLGVDEFPRHLLELMSWLGDNRLTEPLSAHLAATPAATSSPEVWLLGSSGYAAQLAGMLGLPYAYAHHFGQLDPVEVLDAYRSRFEPSPVLSEPYPMLCTSAITADTAEEAEFEAGPAKVMALGMRANKREPLVPPEQAAERGFSELEEAMLSQLPATKFVGAADEVVERLQKLVAASGAVELMIAAATYGAETKARTLEQIADRW
ncbi:LLM class flavin-dependent oxidoreductase [Enemella evansiae]|uniref:LLM class flavin-dependent oxidoreductase n=1 Tax=Enemella evansiae TaxID=2016499 RepID=UPI00105B2338|nr:LLM class flavin-dependent oxidoreductase [Enemella evansiae]TDO92849.1 luciferase family oxidoreductase group 1 [Enemella evansiae]